MTAWDWTSELIHAALEMAGMPGLVPAGQWVAFQRFFSNGEKNESEGCETNISPLYAR
jgi:hypothetical protein